MKQLLMCSAALVVAAAPAIALAQSTGSQDFEDSIIVTGAQGDQSVGGVKIPETPKAKVTLDQEIIARQRPGQAINETLNLVPGVSFSNQDPWGSLGTPADPRNGISWDPYGSPGITRVPQGSLGISRDLC